MNAIHASSAREGQLLPEITQKVAGRQLLMTEEMFCDWLASARAGQQLEYYRGLLAHDRVPSTKVLPERDRVALTALAKRAMQAAPGGRVHLVQRRHGDGDYSYIAVKSSVRLRVIRASARRTDEPRGPKDEPAHRHR
jgi:hypothetical protein